MNELQKILRENNLNFSKNIKGTDKGDFKSYIDLYYYDNFLPLKKKKISLLEIGVRHGASLVLWDKFFDNITIYGVDNLSDSNLDDNPFEYEILNKNNIKLFNMNAYDKANILKFETTFDIIIDDGPHTLKSQLYASKFYSKLLNFNGKLIIEDIQKFGKCSIFFYLFHLSLIYKLKIFDFRYDRKGNDNLLIVIEKNKNYFSNFIIRLYYIFFSILNLPIEILNFFKRRFLNKS